jgi:hypothetical protein
MQQSILLHSGLVTPYKSNFSLIFCCLMRSVLNILGIFLAQFQRFSQGYATLRLSKTFKIVLEKYPKRSQPISSMDNRKSRRQSDW